MKDLFLWSIFLLFCFTSKAQRVYGVNDSTIYLINDQEAFVAGRDILYKLDLSSGSLNVVKNFSELQQTDSLYTQCNTCFIKDFAFNDPAHLWIVYGGFRSGLYESLDGGATWIERTDSYTFPNLPLKKVTAIQIHGSEMYLFQDYYTSTISISTDEGNQWGLFVEGGMACYYFALGFCKNGTIYAYSFATDGRGPHIIKVNDVSSPYYYNFENFYASEMGKLLDSFPDESELRDYCDQIVNDSICSLTSTSLTGITNNTNLLFFPNPAHHTIRINPETDLEGSIMTITDLQGRKVLTKDIKDFEVEVSNIPAGIYVAKISKGNRLQVVQKLIIQ